MDSACSLPLWVEYCRALATPAVALLAAAIAYGQWRSANRKSAYDLFDRRMKAYSDFILAVRRLLMSERLNAELIENVHASINAMKFLFGPEVEKRVGLVEAGVKVVIWKRSGLDFINVPDWAKKRFSDDYVTKVEQVLNEIVADPKLMRRYLQLTQRTV